MRRDILRNGLLFALLVGLHGPASAQAQLPEPAVRGIRVMTFNIRYGTAPDGENRWEARRELVIDLLRRRSPDVLGLQEALRFQIDEIRAALPEYSEVGVGRNDGKTDGEYAVLLWRTDRFRVEKSGNFWFSDKPDVPGSAHWGNRITRICTWACLRERDGGGRFCVFNSHLDHESQPSRERSVILLSKRVEQEAGDLPVVLTGDFNAGEENPAVRYLSGRGSLPYPEAEWAGRRSYRDSFRALNTDRRNTGTFNGFKGTADQEKIDFIWGSSSIRVLQADIVRDNDAGRYPSDHFPVTATVCLPPSP